MNWCKLYRNDGAARYNWIPSHLWRRSERLQRSHVVLEELLCQVLFFATGHQGQETHPLGVAQVRMLPCIALVSTIFQDMKGWKWIKLDEDPWSYFDVKRCENQVTRALWYPGLWSFWSIAWYATCDAVGLITMDIFNHSCGGCYIKLYPKVGFFPWYE